ncbi:MAG: hypothetical protein WBE08_01590 [Methyloceanibacter sp.]|jgi:hypothetical protein
MGQRPLRVLLSLLLAAVSLAGCTHERSGPPQKHFAEFSVAPPKGNVVEVCRAYTCATKTTFYFHKKDINEIALLMRKTKRADTPFEERRAVAYAISLIEKKVAVKLGIKDRPGMEFKATGDPSQQDCVDEATNTTSYLLVLQSNGLIKHHTVQIPFSKGNLLKATLEGDPVKYWPHWTAVLAENKTGQKYAVDSWIYGNGENPAVVKVEDWYIKDLASLPDATY